MNGEGDEREVVVCEEGNVAVGKDYRGMEKQQELKEEEEDEEVKGGRDGRLQTPVRRDNGEREREGQERPRKLFAPRLPKILFIFNKPHGRSFPSQPRLLSKSPG